MQFFSRLNPVAKVFAALNGRIIRSGTNIEYQLRNCILAQHGHLLPTMYDARRSVLRRTGAPVTFTPDYFVPKVYSTNQEAKDRMSSLHNLVLISTKDVVRPGDYRAHTNSTIRNMAIEMLGNVITKYRDHVVAPNIIVSTDGGSCVDISQIYRKMQVREKTGARIIFIEQTSQGINHIKNNLPLAGPVIDVASCLSKRSSQIEISGRIKTVGGIESNIIAKNMAGIFADLLAELPVDSNIGIIGAHGSIGNSLIQQYLHIFKDHPSQPKLLAYNLRNNSKDHVIWMGDIFELVEASSIIVSATGVDVSSNFTSDYINRLITSPKQRVFVNMASNNEFEKLMIILGQKNGTKYNPDQPFSTITCGSLKVLNGGMPSNLVNAITSPLLYDHPNDFVLTRALMYGAQIQAALLLCNPEICNDNRLYKLSPGIEKFVLNLCKEYILKNNPELLDAINEILNTNILNLYKPNHGMPDALESVIEELFPLCDNARDQDYSNSSKNYRS